jgi:DNA-directed RNA polymerase specialized sigma24 family protein
MTDTSNNPLVIAAQAGDMKSFAALVDKNYAMVHGLVYSKIGDWTVAEDVTQDVFLVVWSNLNKLQHPEAFLVWLRQIARNASVNWVRKEQYRRSPGTAGTVIGRGRGRPRGRDRAQGVP